MSALQQTERMGLEGHLGRTAAERIALPRLISSEFLHLPLDRIQLDPTQPRKALGDLQELQASLQISGLIQPLIVSPLQADSYLLVAGERRYSAARALGWETIPVLVRSVAEQERLLLQLTENLQRQDLSPFEEADGYARLMQEMELTQEEIARNVGKSVATLNETLALLRLSQAIRTEWIRTSETVSKSLLLEIAKADTQEAQLALWEWAKRGKLTVRLARQQRKASQQKPARVMLQLPEATLMLVFRGGRTCSQAAVRQVLQAALAQIESEADLSAENDLTGA